MVVTMTAKQNVPRKEERKPQRSPTTCLATQGKLLNPTASHFPSYLLKNKLGWKQRLQAYGGT